ncbi:MAG: ribonuclease [Burkholderiaceae bacterium]
MAAIKSIKLALTGLILVASSIAGLVYSRAPQVTPDHTATISIAELPAQGAQMVAQITRGGPFPHEKDGAVFGNRERLLPIKSRGYYREYTVATPGLEHRGVRRIVCGGKPRVPEACYYSADHYASFRMIVP